MFSIDALVSNYACSVALDETGMVSVIPLFVRYPLPYRQDRRRKIELFLEDKQKANGMQDNFSHLTGCYTKVLTTTNLKPNNHYFERSW